MNALSIVSQRNQVININASHEVTVERKLGFTRRSIKNANNFAVHEYKIPSYVKIDIEKLFLSTINYLTELQTAVRLHLSQ